MSTCAPRTQITSLWSQSTRNGSVVESKQCRYGVRKTTYRQYRLGTLCRRDWSEGICCLCFRIYTENVSRKKKLSCFPTKSHSLPWPSAACRRSRSRTGHQQRRGSSSHWTSQPRNHASPSATSGVGCIDGSQHPQSSGPRSNNCPAADQLSAVLADMFSCSLQHAAEKYLPSSLCPKKLLSNAWMAISLSAWPW